MTKKILFILCLSAVSFLSKSQALRLGSISLDAGAGLGWYEFSTHFPIDKNNAYNDILFTATLPCVNAELALTRWVGIGVRYRSGYYSTFSTNMIPGTDLAYRLTFYIGNKNNNKFNIPIGISYGGTDFRYTPSDGKGHIFGSGSLYNLHISPHFYPTKLLGVYFSFGFNSHVLNKINYMDTDGTVYTEKDDYHMSMYGVYFEGGLTFRLHLLPNLRKEKPIEHEAPSKQTITY
jgi:hypothetical protein